MSINVLRPSLVCGKTCLVFTVHGNNKSIILNKMSRSKKLLTLALAKGSQSFHANEGRCNILKFKIMFLIIICLCCVPYYIVFINVI